jgi:hypothetical protein
MNRNLGGLFFIISYLMGYFKFIPYYSMVLFSIVFFIDNLFVYLRSNHYYKTITTSYFKIAGPKFDDIPRLPFIIDRIIMISFILYFIYNIFINYQYCF